MKRVDVNEIQSNHIRMFIVELDIQFSFNVRAIFIDDGTRMYWNRFFFAISFL